MTVRIVLAVIGAVAVCGSTAGFAVEAADAPGNDSEALSAMVVTAQRTSRCWGRSSIHCPVPTSGNS